ncbi:MAG: hypothetical protein CUN51_02720 [Candidatus Thermofonsia Clade 1 bacterium]|uniref:Uncharacterized protein n=1 Tax=Candidatus Thermofonsia Clade 1 bacterium TaxID=2364210 RepID=A0A2M8P2V1_9CHLR|nr:MAG: hypothetical protein CUN51_02720 [Candidatus Thermofonsia Clade 1 bacterium]
MNVIQDEEDGDLRRALQPFVDELVQSAPPSLSAPALLVTIIPPEPQDYQATLENAIALNNQGNYEAALPLLERLKVAGLQAEALKTTQRSVQWQQQLRAEQEARRQRLAALHRAYEDIALLARSQATLRNAWGE